MVNPKSLCFHEWNLRGFFFLSILEKNTSISSSMLIISRCDIKHKTEIKILHLICLETPHSCLLVHLSFIWKVCAPSSTMSCTVLSAICLGHCSISTTARNQQNTEDLHFQTISSNLRWQLKSYVHSTCKQENGKENRSIWNVNIHKNGVYFMGIKENEEIYQLKVKKEIMKDARTR